MKRLLLLCLCASLAIVACKKDPEKSSSEIITLSDSELRLYVGETYQIEATVPSQEYEVIWSSSDQKVATVDNGLVSALKTGFTNIRALYGKSFATCELNVMSTSLTVAQGANSDYSEIIPFWGYHHDKYTKCQFVYPASELASIKGATIKSIKFYIRESTNTTWDTNQQIYLFEVDSNTYKYFYETKGDDLVFSGKLAPPVNKIGEWEIPLSTSYEYKGGNLCFIIYNTEKGNRSGRIFFGKYEEGIISPYCEYSDGLESLMMAKNPDRSDNFLPKITFVCGR